MAGYMHRLSSVSHTFRSHHCGSVLVIRCRLCGSLQTALPTSHLRRERRCEAFFHDRIILHSSRETGIPANYNIGRKKSLKAASKTIWMAAGALVLIRVRPT